MLVRRAQAADIDRILSIYENACSYMRSTGNGQQWQNGYPKKSLLEQDIQSQNSYVCCLDGCIAGTFYCAVENEPAYKKIKSAWLNDKTYALIHRLACAVPRKGIAGRCLHRCFSAIQNIRVDTHKDNIRMQNLLKKHGYVHCRVIYLIDRS